MTVVHAIRIHGSHPTAIPAAIVDEVVVDDGVYWLLLREW